MADADPQIVAQWVEEGMAETGIVRLLDFLPTVLRRYYKDRSDEQIAEQAELIQEAVAKSLERRVAEELNNGVTLNYRVEKDGTEYYLHIDDTPDGDLLKKLRKSSPIAFEHFCRRAVEKLGGTSFVSGGSNDGGVDFFGVGLRVGTDAGPRPPTSCCLLIGQAKRYSKGNSVKETEVRSFVGGAILQAEILKKQYADRIGLLSPTQLAFWSTSHFTPHAANYCRSLGIWFLGGVGVTQLAMRLGLSDTDIVEPDGSNLHVNGKAAEGGVMDDVQSKEDGSKRSDDTMEQDTGSATILQAGVN